MKTLVTGKGLVGSQIKNAVSIGSADVDLLDEKATLAFFEHAKPEIVIHTAARVGGLGANMANNLGFFEDNIQINMNVLKAAEKVGVKKFVGYLSTCIFPDKVEYPLKEEYIHLGEPHPSNYGYAYAKRMLDIQVRAINQKLGTSWTNIIPTNIYGTNDNFNLQNSHVIPALIHKCYLAKKNNTNLEVWGSGKPLREFIFSKDIAQISEWIAHNYEGKDAIIVSTSDEISIADVVGLIVKHMKFEGKVVFKTDQPDGQYRKPTDTSKLKNLLPNFKFTSIDEGLEETINWFEENYNTLRK